MEDVAKMKPEHPSAFYSLVEGATEAVLLYLHSKIEMERA